MFSSLSRAHSIARVNVVISATILNIMTTLYHGSGYKQTELMPGFKRSGVLVEWDQTESNKYLYATTDMDTAIGQGFASAVEKLFKMNRFSEKGHEILIEIEGDKIPSLEELQSVNVYLYTIDVRSFDEWEKVNNAVNGLETEYKTQHTIKDGLHSVEKVDLKKWLGSRHVKIIRGKPSYAKW